MASYRQQTLIEAPIESVWREVGDPSGYPRWAGDFAEVTDLDEVKVGATFHTKSKTPIGTTESDFVVEQLDEMRGIQVRCLLSGYYMRWLLTEAGEDTFAEVEIGMDPTRMRYQAMDKTVGRRWYRNLVDQTLDRLRAIVK